MDSTIDRSRVVIKILTTQEWATARTRDVEDLLTDLERARAGRFRRAQDRADFVAAHVLAREVVAELVRLAIDVIRLDQACPRCGSTDHGAPRVTVPRWPSASVSWSHCRGRVAAVAGWEPVGIDVERPRHASCFRDVMRGVLSPSEVDLVLSRRDVNAAFLHWWTRKEALVKVGAITLEDFATTDLSGSQDIWGEWKLTGWHDKGRDAVVAVVTR